MTAIYLGHGAPPLLDDRLWTGQLAEWATAMPRPKAILVVSAHWESAPVTLGTTEDGVGLVYDFWGFPERYYQMRYPAPGAPELAEKVVALLPDSEPVARRPRRGLDHGAYVPLMAMYPEADIPTLQMSLPTLDPVRLIELGSRLRHLHQDGVLIMGSGFMTHGLPHLTDWRVEARPPEWSVEFDLWAAEAMADGDLDALIDFRAKAPGMPYAHPTVEHFVPLFIALGAAERPDAPVRTTIDGYFMGLAKRSFEVG